MLKPRPYKKPNTHKRIAVVDLETDPFKHGRKIAPFSCGFYDGEAYFDFWGDDCISQFFAFLAANYSPGSLAIYAHNGGNFDFLFMLSNLDDGQTPLIIGGRIVSVVMGGQEFRDSYAAMPVPLAKLGAKGSIDYEAKMTRETREANKREILDYQKQDCLVLYRAVMSFIEQFGERPTIGGTASAMLRSFHGSAILTEKNDELFRRFYYGGRVECFEMGAIFGDFKYIDKNSMYPDVMAKYKHPVSAEYTWHGDLVEGFHFAKIDAVSRGALPFKEEKGALNFPNDRQTRTYYASAHEIRAALELGLLDIKKVHFAAKFSIETDFSEYVNTFYSLRLAATDQYLKEFYKLLLNSAYGRFAIDPRKFWTYEITDGPAPSDEVGLYNEEKNPNGWQLGEIAAAGKCFWRRRGDYKRENFSNVATAASITGAARAELLRGIAGVKRPLYCDTDSLVCEDTGALKLDPKTLGEWKLEALIDEAHISGKKTYALFFKGKKVKMASKGAKLDEDELREVAAGKIIKYEADAPKLKINGKQIYVSRDIKKTGVISKHRKTA